MQQKGTEIENKISSVTDLVNVAALNTKTVNMENKISDFTNLAAKPALNIKTKTIKM